MHIHADVPEKETDGAESTAFPQESAGHKCVRGHRLLRSVKSCELELRAETAEHAAPAVSPLINARLCWG